MRSPVVPIRLEYSPTAVPDSPIRLEYSPAVPILLEYSLEYSPTAVPCSPCKIGFFPGIFPLKSKIIEIFSLKSLLQCCRDGKSLENSISAVAAALQRWKIPGKFHCCSTAALQQ
eukprot:sb/3476735/